MVFHLWVLYANALGPENFFSDKPLMQLFQRHWINSKFCVFLLITRSFWRIISCVVHISTSCKRLRNGSTDGCLSIQFYASISGSGPFIFSKNVKIIVPYCASKTLHGFRWQMQIKYSECRTYLIEIRKKSNRKKAYSKRNTQKYIWYRKSTTVLTRTAVRSQFESPDEARFMLKIYIYFFYFLFKETGTRTLLVRVLKMGAL